MMLTYLTWICGACVVLLLIYTAICTGIGIRRKLNGGELVPRNPADVIWVLCPLCSVPHDIQILDCPNCNADLRPAALLSYGKPIDVITYEFDDETFHYPKS